MTAEQSAAYVMGQAACLNARVAGMQAENAQRAHQGLAMAYVEADFVRVIDEHYCHNNAAMDVFRGVY